MLGLDVNDGDILAVKRSVTTQAHDLVIAVRAGTYFPARCPRSMKTNSSWIFANPEFPLIPETGREGCSL